MKVTLKAGAVHHYELYHQEEEKAYALAVEQNLFIESTMQIHTYRELSQREMDAFRIALSMIDALI